MEEEVEILRTARWIDMHPIETSLKDDVLAGLRSMPKTLPPKLFYDDAGSHLFEAITRLPEYYLTRTELSILEEIAPALAAHAGDDVSLIEFGSGSSTKVRLLLDQLRGRVSYVPIDVSREHLRPAADAIARDFPGVEVTAVCADYMQPLDLPFTAQYRRRMIFFPGSTIGNIEPEQTPAFLQNAVRLLQNGDLMVIGADLQKDPSVLHAAYNDSQGITAEFNFNLLHRINRELGGTFDVPTFEHIAFYDEARGRIEMHLRSTRRQVVTVAGESISFEEGETIHTENSNKYRLAQIDGLAATAALKPLQHWTDPDKRFAVLSYELSRADV